MTDDLHIRQLLARAVGREQEKWLLDGFGRSRARSNVLANQVPFARMIRHGQTGLGYSMDKWDGYSDSRRRVLEAMRQRRLSNPIVITGDVHVSWVAASLDVPDAPPIGTEFVGTSISSGGDGSVLTPEGKIMLEQNSTLRYHCGQRGYVRCTVTPERWTSDYRLVPYITRPDAPVRTDASFVVESGRPGVERAG